MIKLTFLILILTCSVTFANDRLRGYQALEQKDYKTALYYLSYDANLGDDKAQYNLGIMYNRGLGVPVDKNEAFSWLGSGKPSLIDNTTFQSCFNEPNGISSLFDE